MYSGPSVLRNAVKQLGRAKGAVVGHHYEVQTFTSPTTGTITTLVHLPGERFVPNAGTLPVVGGTGRYAGARGTSYTRDLRPGRSLNVYYLRIP